MGRFGALAKALGKGSAKAAGEGAVFAGVDSFVRSTVHDFLSGGKGEDAAIARGNKSAIMARENREAEYDRQIATQEVQYQDERYAPLNSGDEFLDEVYSKLGEIDNKMGKMLAHFVAQDKREEKQAILDRQSNLSRKLGKDKKKEEEGAVPGGSGTTNPMSMAAGFVGGGGGGGGPQTPPGGDNSFFGTAAEFGLAAAVEKVLGKGGQRLLNTKAGKAVLEFGKKAATAAKSASGTALNVGKSVGGFGLKKVLPGVQAAGGVYQLATANGKSVEDAAERNMGFMEGVEETTSTGEKLDLQKMAELGKYTSVASDNEKLAQQISGALNLVGGIAGFIPGYGTAISVVTGLMSLFAEHMLSKPDKATLDRLGIDEDDYENASLLLQEDGVNNLASKLVAEGYGGDQVTDLVVRAARAASALYAGLGDVSAPETWPVEWSSNFLGKSVLERLQDHEGSQYEKDLYEGILEYQQGILNDAATQFVPETEDEMKKEAEEGYPYRKKMKSWIENNKLLVGDILNTFINNDNVSGIIPYFGMGVQPEYEKSFMETMKSHNFRRHQDGGFVYAKESPMWNSALKNGLWVTEGDHRKFLISPGVEPAFMAEGGMLNSATSLGTYEAEAINSLENSGNQIKDVIKEGFSGVNDEWFDDALMGYFMDSVLPGLVGALKNDKQELGIATPVSVFG